MASIWQIKGEAGKALDATVRDFHEVGSEGQISWPTLATGTFSFTKVLDSLDGAGELIPELNQQVTLYRDGVQVFTGLVTSEVQQGYQVSIVVSDAWWNAEQEPLSSMQTSPAGNTMERASYAFPAQPLHVSLAALVNRSIAAGVPWQLGTIPAALPLPQITLVQQSYAAAITELVRLSPDMQAWLDHSTAPPTLRFSRRPTATAVTLDARMISGFRAQPKLEMKIDKVTVPYLTRATNGEQKFAEQTAGTTGRRQLMVVSGEELDTFLPNDQFSQFQIQTISPVTDTWNLLAWVNTADPFIAGLRAQYGEQWYGATYFGGGVSTGAEIYVAANGVSLHYKQNSFDTTPLTYPTAPTILRDLNGISQPGKHAVRSGRVPEWGSALGLVVTQGTMSVDVVVSITWSQSMAQPFYPGVTAFGAKCIFTVQNVWTQDGQRRQMFLLYRASIPVDIVTQSYPALTTLYSPADYSFIHPPEGFAAGLLAAQNWVPYEGFANLKDQECGGQRYSGKVINLSNARPALANMRALVAGETLDLSSGSTTIDLGAPPRLSFQNVVDRIRRTSQDNIVYL